MSEKRTSPERHVYQYAEYKDGAYIITEDGNPLSGPVVVSLLRGSPSMNLLDEHTSLTERVRGFEQTMDALVERAERVQEGEDWDMAEFILRKRDAFLENEKDDPTAPDPAD